jgi:hypothetical protein
MAAGALFMSLCLTALMRQTGSVSEQARTAALTALDRYLQTHPGAEPSVLAIADYTKPSCLKRLAIIDLRSGAVSCHLLAHGKQSGTLHARSFSNTSGSGMSSLGLYRVIGNYAGSHGRALRLEGLDPLLNSNAFRRDIVLHAAPYVSIPYIMLNLFTFNGPRIGRSNGCFVVSPQEIDEVSTKLGTNGFIFAYAGQRSDQ